MNDDPKKKPAKPDAPPPQEEGAINAAKWNEDVSIGEIRLPGHAKVLTPEDAAALLEGDEPDEEEDPGRGE